MTITENAAIPVDETVALSALTRAFSTDPVARWMYPETGRYLTHFPEIIRAFGGKAFESGTAQVLETASAAALWLPPGIEPDEETLWPPCSARFTSIYRPICFLSLSR
jgi:hypothetical protein